MAISGSTEININMDNDEITGSTKTRKIIVVGHIGDDSARIVAATERMKYIGKDVEVELITPEQALERGITITTKELFAPEAFLISDPYKDSMYTDYDGKFDRNKKGKRGYTSPYKYHK
jgi:hypothetical protein